MKRLLLTMLFVAASVSVTYAQDIIVTNDGNRIECTIVSESDQVVSYKEWGDKKGVIRKLLKSSVWSVAYDKSLKQDDRIVEQSNHSTNSDVNGSIYSNETKNLASVPTQDMTSLSVPYKNINRERRRYITRGVVGCVLYLPLMLGGSIGGALLLGEDSAWGYVLIGAGLAGGITSLSLGIVSLNKASEAKYACVMDLPVSDKFSIGLYDYAFVPTQSYGAGIGMKFRF